MKPFKVKFIPYSKEISLYGNPRYFGYDYPMVEDGWRKNDVTPRLLELRNLAKKDGKIAVYKYGGFSGDMNQENKHLRYGWHILNFDTWNLANEYAALGNEQLIIWNYGGGIYHVKEDDRSTKPHN